MAYNAPSYPVADTATARHDDGTFQVYEDDNPNLGRIPLNGLGNLHLGQNSQAFGGYSPGAIDDTDNLHGFQTDHVETNDNNSLGRNIHNSDVFTAQPPVPFVRPTSLPQVSRLPPYAYHIPGTPHSLYNFNHTPTTPIEDAMRKQLGSLVTGVSVNYLGDPYLKANQSANIPDELNTSVWITNMPPNATHKVLLDSIRDCGKVYACVVNGPENGHIASAAKVVFWDVAGAGNLLQQAREGKFIVGGYVPRVRRNRIKTEPRLPSPNSRVLHIEGPSCIVNQPFLANLFHSNGITWQDEEILVLSNSDLLTRLEWRFGSYRCQAESARLLIDRMKKRWDLKMLNEYQYQLWQSVTVHFGVDPCAPKPVTQHTSSFQGLQPQGPHPQDNNRLITEGATVSVRDYSYRSSNLPSAHFR